MTDDAARERSVRLFQFLRELTLLKSQAIRTLEKYDKVLWFDDVPLKDSCFSVFRQEAEERSELWLEIEQPKTPSPPKLPESLIQWVDSRDLLDATNISPSLKKTISVQHRVALDSLKDANELEALSESGSEDISLSISTNASPKSSIKKNLPGFKKYKYTTELVKLSDSPEVSEAFENYVQTEWKPWAEQVRPFAPVQKLYDQLFEIHHTLQKLGESYELLLGLGCLSWLTPSHQSVYRHVLTAPASLHFDAIRGVISISAPSEGLRYSLEQDMLELPERPQGVQRKEIDSVLEQLTEDFWNPEKLDSLLESFVHSVSSRGVYSEELKRSPSAENEPVINLAPALIFRQRTDLHFVRLFDEIVTQIENGEELPIGVERLVSIMDDEDHSTDIEVPPGDLVDEEIYFPLAANPDQREIAQKLRDRQGILVQGPPGTGKSHTIANLVCHLLASGKRILVTSHTPRALTVLRDKFPQDMQALCVSMVGDDTSDSRKALEDSVAGITAKHNSWNKTQNTAYITELREQLDDLRRGEQWSLNSLRSIKEKDTYNHPSKFTNYSGTAQSIAKRLQQEFEIYGWLPVTPEEKDDPPISNSEMLELLSLARRFSSEFEKNVRRSTISSEQLLTPIQFTELCAKIRSATDLTLKVQSLKTHDCYEASTKLARQDRDHFVQRLDSLLLLFHRISKRPEEFAKRAARDIIGDHDRKWRELLILTTENLAKLNKDYRQIVQKAVAGIAGLDSHTVRAQAFVLKEHFSKGGRIGFGPFRSKAVSDGLYLTKEVRIDGVLCDNVSTLEELIEYLDLEIIVQALRKNWSDVYDSVPVSTLGAIAAIQDCCEPLSSGLELHDQMNAVRDDLAKFPALIAPQWDDADSIKAFRDVIAAGAAEEELTSCREQMFEFETRLRSVSSSPNAHPVTSVLLDSVLNLDEEQYYSAFEKNEKLHSEKRGLKERDRLFDALSYACPQLSEDLKSDSNDLKWDQKCSCFEEAWNWARASKWIADLSDPGTYKRYSYDLETSQNKIRETLRNLAAAKAWEHTFKRLTEKQRQHLISWSMAVRRIGKGTGKYAEKHRRDARLHMDKCRSAIPAWIMPIHKVVETVRPGTDMFDVIIVDEASQSGPEALFLLYIGKQIVVVGDDKQISPDFVGMDRSSVDALREQFLKNIPHADAIGIEHSFFDQAKIRYRGKIRLKEHFRCMPEIIQFSNNLCYSSDPLIPLRQYGGGRITPVVKAVHVPNGYVDDNSTKPVNIPECEVLLNEIKRICNDPAYSGKTIGVISLLNTSGQAKFIENELRNSEKYIAKAEFESRQIRVGDAYMFQGDERDIILLSMVSAPSEKGTRLYPMTAEKDERRFNVAVSRARDQLFLFHSVSLSELSPKCIRHQLLSYCINPSVEVSEVASSERAELTRLLVDGYAFQTTPPKPFDSWFEVDVFLRISERGFRVLPQVPMNGYSIDLIVEGLRGRLAVECDGDRWHGPERYDSDMARQRDLERCGMQFWRLRGSAFYHNPEKALEELWRTLERMQITPSVSNVLRTDEISEERLRTLNFSATAEDLVSSDLLE